MKPSPRYYCVNSPACPEAPAPSVWVKAAAVVIVVCALVLFVSATVFAARWLLS